MVNRHGPEAGCEGYPLDTLPVAPKLPRLGHFPGLRGSYGNRCEQSKKVSEGRNFWVRIGSPKALLAPPERGIDDGCNLF